MFLFYTILCLIIHLTVYSNCDDNQVIRLADSNSKSNTFYVKRGKSLDIVFENTNATSVLCNGDDLKSSINNLFQNNLKILTIKEIKFTKWTCILYDSSNISYNFYLKERYVDVNIGQMTLDFTHTNSITYDYIEGEIIDWSCSMNENGNLKFIYYDSKGSEWFQSDQIYERVNQNSQHALKFQQLMTARHNSSYVVCNYTKTNGNVVDFFYKTIFNMKTGTNNNDDFIVKINGVKLTCGSHSSKVNSNIYEYKYIYGEVLTVSFERKNKSIHVGINVTCNKDNEKMYQNRLKIDTKWLNDSNKIICEDDHKNIVKINLYKEYDRDPVILGLRPGNLLYQYTKNQYEWITHYEYSQNEMSNLTCNSTDQDREIKHFVNGQEYISYNTIPNEMILNNITCEARRKGNITRRMIVIISGNNKSSLILPEDQRPSLQSPDVPDSGGNSNIIYIAVAAGILCATIIIIYVSYWYMKHKSITKESRFGLFNNEGTNIPDLSRQWESNEYTYIETPEYIKPYGTTMENSIYYSSIRSHGNRISTTDTENHYTEINDNFNCNQNQTNGLNSANYENQNVINNETFVNNDDYCVLKSNCVKRYVNLRGDPMTVDYSNIIKDSSNGYENFHSDDNSTSNCSKY